MNWFSPKPCPVCGLKDAVIERLRDDLARERLRLTRAEARADTALDNLLREAGRAPVTPPVKYTQTESDNVMREMFAMFKDEDDKGDGKVRDVDNLDFDHR